MNMLEDQFKDMRDQQHKILFSNKDNDTFYDEENVMSGNEEDINGGKPPGSINLNNT
jgi:hypothetical protein